MLLGYNKRGCFERKSVQSSSKIEGENIWENLKVVSSMEKLLNQRRKIVLRSYAQQQKIIKEACYHIVSKTTEVKVHKEHCEVNCTVGQSKEINQFGYSLILKQFSVHLQDFMVLKGEEYYLANIAVHMKFIYTVVATTILGFFVSNGDLVRLYDENHLDLSRLPDFVRKLVTGARFTETGIFVVTLAKGL